MPRLSSAADSLGRRLRGVGTLPLVFIAITGAAAWTCLGVLLSLVEDGADSFLHEWVLLQGPPLLALGLFLSVFSRGERLHRIASALECTESLAGLPKRTRALLVLFVTVVGTLSLIALGFPAAGASLAFMWLTCLLICLMASQATEHAARLLLFSAELSRCTLKLHPYSPADTPALRKLAEYVAFVGLVITIGYCFAFAGTLSGNWTAGPERVMTVGFFWPLIYVPLCLATLAYPHVAIYRIVRAAKDETIRGLQLKMVALSAQDAPMSNDDVARLNALADLVRKIEDTPNYPRNVSLVGTLALTGLVNVGSLLLPREALAEVVRRLVDF